MANGKNGNGTSQIVAIATIVAMVILALAYIAATVLDESGKVKETVTVIMVVLAALGLALQTAQAKQQIQVIHDRTEANDKKLEVIGMNVDGLNKAALANQVIISEAKGKQDTLDVVVAVADATGKEKKPPLVPSAAVTPPKKRK